MNTCRMKYRRIRVVYDVWQRITKNRFSIYLPRFRILIYRIYFVPGKRISNVAKLFQTNLLNFCVTFVEF